MVQVTFRDEASTTLLSGSADGQLAVFDLSGGLNEDDAFQVRRATLLRLERGLKSGRHGLRDLRQQPCYLAAACDRLVSTDH
jgi:hypothetical protein